jgi:hypothetical protein
MLLGSLRTGANHGAIFCLGPKGIRTLAFLVNEWEH